MRQRGLDPGDRRAGGTAVTGPASVPAPRHGKHEGPLPLFTTRPGPDTARIVRSLKSVAMLLVPALIGVGLVVAARPEDPAPVADRSDDLEPLGVDLPPAGLVVTLARQGADLPVAHGAEASFLVGTDATQPVRRVELWDGGDVVATYEPPGDRTSLQPSLDWVPTEVGQHLLTARAVDADGRVGLSNPMWVEVTDDRPVTVSNDAVPAGFALPAGPAAEPPPAVVPAAGRGLRWARQVGGALPTLALATDGCTVEASAGPAPGGEQPVDLILLTVLPGGGKSLPMADLGAVAPGASAKASALIGGGPQGFVVAAVTDGAVAGWSAPVVADPGDQCPPPGWDGELQLVDEHLHADTDLAEAYLYLEPEPGRWVRVPSTGAVPNLGGGTFDFTGLLPNLPGAYQLHAWGRTGNEVAPLGTGAYTPPTPGPDESDVTFGGFVPPPTTLRWLKPASKGQLGSFQTSGTIVVDPDDHLIGTHKFSWSTPFSATHAFVQVSLDPLPGDAGPSTQLPQFTCLVPGHQGVFTIDFDQETCSPSMKSTAVSATPGGGYGNLVPVDVGLLGEQPNVGTKNPLDELEKQLGADPEAPPGTEVPWVEQRVVRVLPMTGDSWVGYRSNDVALELDRTPKAPPGEYAYDLDLKVVGAPHAPRYRYMACWQFTGWDDPAAAAVLANQEAQQLKALHGNDPFAAVYTIGYPHLFWSGILAKTGGGPICPGCYGVAWPGIGGATVGLGGADCSSDSSFWEDPVGWVGANLVGPVIAVFKAMVDLAADGFAYLKQQAVQGLMTITGCSGQLCETLANAVVNGALLALGVPPTIPNFDQLVALGKGELVDAAVELMEAAGIPCESAGTAATFHGDDDLTCEAALEAMLDELSTAVNETYLAVAKSGGITFADDMHVVPWWAGQPGNAKVEVTVKPTKYTAEEQGTTCSAGVLTSSMWTAPSTSVTDPDLGNITIPQTSWSTFPYDVTSWQLPTLAKKAGAQHGYAPATKTFTLAPRSLPLVTVQKPVKGLVGQGVSFPYQVSPYAFYFHKDSTFWISVGGACARPETLKLTLSGSGQATVESVVEG